MYEKNEPPEFEKGMETYKKNKNEEVLATFMTYCIDHPDERFWQALQNWSSYAFILGAKEYPQPGERELDLGTVEDTFYKEGK